MDGNTRARIETSIFGTWDGDNPRTDAEIAEGVAELRRRYDGLHAAVSGATSEYLRWVYSGEN